MNIFFHVVTAVGVVAATTNTREIKSLKDSIAPAFISFGSSFIIHGILDYLPHGYPFSPKVDVLLSLIVIFALIMFCNKEFRLILSLSILGSITPDLIDLLPSILNKYIGSCFSDEKFFPWHWSTYSGSIFGRREVVSDINHIAIIMLTFFVCWVRRDDLKRIFRKRF